MPYRAYAGYSTSIPNDILMLVHNIKGIDMRKHIEVYCGMQGRHVQIFECYKCGQNKEIYTEIHNAYVECGYDEVEQPDHPYITDFANAMNEEMLDHQAEKGSGWRTIEIRELIPGLLHKTIRLSQTMRARNKDDHKVRQAAIHVGNYAMMIYNRHRDPTDFVPNGIVIDNHGSEN